MDISVIIPVYNTEKFLRSCIDSILVQANVSFEIILVDDGSSDSSPVICDTYANKYNNIKVFHIKNSGPATARNEGFKVAQGEYITFTDSDDKMEPLMLFKMISAGKEHHADIICCNYKEVDEEGHITDRIYSNQTYILNHEDALVHFYSKDKIFSQCWTKLFKRQLLIDHHIENDPTLRFDEDIIYNIKAFKHAQTTVIIDEPLYEYTLRGNSLAHGEYYIKHTDQYINDSIKRVQITLESVKDETDRVKEWSNVHILLYHNQLLGRVASLPKFHSDKRIKEILKYMRGNRIILRKYYKRCGLSIIGMLLISYLPSGLYMIYRKSKTGGKIVKPND